MTRTIPESEAAINSDPEFRTERHELEDFLREHCELVGAKLLKILISEPNTPLDAIELSLRYQTGKPELKGLLCLLDQAFPPIPLSDSKAINAYKKRIRQLIAIKSETGLDPALEEELSFITRELRRVTTPQGCVKQRFPEKERAYKRFYIALKRVLEIARKENPPVYDLVRRNLSCGLAFKWRDEWD